MTITNPINYIKSIDLTALRNIGTFLLAKAGNEKAIIEMAIQYLIQNNDEKASPYVIYIEDNNLCNKFPIIADYYDFCLDYHFRYSYDELFSFNEYNSKRSQYRHQWYVTKRAIKDKLIHKYDITNALALTTINDDDKNDFIEYLFNNIKNKNDLFKILLEKSQLLKKSLTYGYQKRYLNLKDLINISFYNEETAKILLSMIQSRFFSKLIDKKQLTKWVFELGDSFASIRGECGQMCLQFGSAENAKKLLSSNKDTPPHYEQIISKTRQTNISNNLNDDSTSDNNANTRSVSLTAFNKAHKKYLSSLGFFSHQSSATKDVINKASQTNISDYERYQILKAYIDDKNNNGRRFKSCITSLFSKQFRGIEAVNDSNNHKLMPCKITYKANIK